jgi:hypothetical protein
MRSLLLVLVLTSTSSVFGQAEPPSSSGGGGSRQERMLGFLQQFDTNHDGQIDADEIQAAGPRANVIEAMIRRAGMEPKYPIKISEIQEAMEKARSGREGGGGFIGTASAKEPPKFKTLKEVLEALPRKPEKGDNNLAAKVANEWLQTNALGSVIHITGRLQDIGEMGDKRIWLRLKPKQGAWENHHFTLEVGGNAPRNVNKNDLSKIIEGDVVTLEGRVSNLEMKWERGNGTIQLSLADCKLVSVNQPEGNTTGLRITAEPPVAAGKGEPGQIIVRETVTAEKPEANKKVLIYKEGGTTVSGGPATIPGGPLSLFKSRKFWTGKTDDGECAVSLEDVECVRYVEMAGKFGVIVYFKGNIDKPIDLIYGDKEKAHSAYQSLLKALEESQRPVPVPPPGNVFWKTFPGGTTAGLSGSADFIVKEQTGKSQEAKPPVTGKVVPPPVKKPVPEEKGLFD